MLRIDRICTVLFIIAFALIIPSVKLATFIDELIAGLLGTVAIADCLFNNAWRRYTLLWVIIAIMTFYAGYSLIFLHYNTPAAILSDWIIQLKPYVPFAVFLSIRPVLSDGDKQWLRIIAIVNAVICLISFILPMSFMAQVMGHVYFAGIVLLLSATIYAYTSGITLRCPRNVIAIVGMLATGLLCGRSKYFGEFVVAIFFLFFYTRTLYKDMTWQRRIIILSIPLLIFAVGWSKFSYYFLTGESTTYDPSVIESYARPVLYATGALILIDKLPFGSGLASFASWSSIEPYSSLYHEYRISSVYGLSPANPTFICDAFYPSLAQFGIVGVILFITFWVYVIRLLKKLIRSNPVENRLYFACGWIIVITILIESIASTTFVQTAGMWAMMLLGIICAKAESQEDTLTIKDADNEKQRVLQRN